MTGTVAILNVSAGDTKLTFDKSNPAEAIRAARIVKDMLRRGYALLIEVGQGEDGKPLYQRAKDFDENTNEYIIADFDPMSAITTAKDEPNEEGQEEAGTDQPASAEAPRPKGNRKAAGTRRVPATGSTAVAVARTAGG